MNIRQKTYFISLFILLICLVLAAVIYVYTGNLVIAIFFAPPVVHWILKKRNESREN